MRIVYQNNQEMKLKIEQAIEMARKNQSLEGAVIEDLKETQVRAVDALILAEHGIVIPEQNIYYSDEEIAYDPDFDEVKWSEEPLRMTWEEKIKMFEGQEVKRKAPHRKENELTVKIEISDQEVREWVKKNQKKLGQLLGGLITDLYKVRTITKK